MCIDVPPVALLGQAREHLELAKHNAAEARAFADTPTVVFQCLESLCDAVEALVALAESGVEAEAEGGAR